MTNLDLSLRIEECLSEFNPLDCIEKIVELRKDYKDSEFYKKTKMNFEQCIEMYGKVYQLKMSRRSFGDMIEDYLINLDEFKLQRIVDKFGDRLEKIDLSSIEEFLQGLASNLDFNELQTKIQEFEELNKRASKL